MLTKICHRLRNLNSTGWSMWDCFERSRFPFANRLGSQLAWSRTLLWMTCFLGALMLLSARASSQRYDGPCGTQQQPPASHGSTGPRSALPSVIFVPEEPWFPPTPGSCAAGASEARAEQLDKNGPYLAPLYSMSTFAIMGYAKGNWPVVVDYQVEQNSLVLLVVSAEGKPPQVYHLPGEKKHYQIKVTLPDWIGDQPRVAQYLLENLDPNVGGTGPAYIHIHGIAAGPKAVGSIGIDQVDFGPSHMQLSQHQKAQYSFHAKRDFKHTEVTVVKLALSGNGEIIAAAVHGDKTGSVSENGNKSGEWDGSVKLPGKNYSEAVRGWLMIPTGEHAVQVRGWFASKDGGDWVTALSDLISVE